MLFRPERRRRKWRNLVFPEFREAVAPETQRVIRGEYFVEGFTKKYGIHMLVWYEPHETMAEAITREKAVKRWRRAWKLELIKAFNPEWKDLSWDI